MVANFAINNIRQLIKENGYISIATFMESIARNYYSNRDAIGPNADFITSPEVSQIFGEMVGIWVAMNWQKMQSPPQISLVEFGPGKGTLMNDLLRATKNISGFHEALSVHLIENSNKLQAVQQETLSKWCNINFQWHQEFKNFPQAPIIIVANEFLDALPIHQYIKIKNNWFENIVTTLILDGEFCIAQMPVSKTIEEMLNYEHPNASHRAIVEMSPISIDIIKLVANHFKKSPGIALFVDYGYEHYPLTRKYYNPTLQAVKNHRYHPILSDMGEADITAHVDFFALKQAAIDSQCNVYGTVTQREFLLELGILYRMEQLLHNLPLEKQNIIINGVERLISNDKMGKLFKVLAISSKNVTSNIGFNKNEL